MPMNPAHMSGEALEAEADQLDGHPCDWDDNCPSCVRANAVNQEIDARDLWDHEDARVRESVGNYR